MIGSGLKKLAVEYSMKVDKGVAYGSLQGYAATMCEGSGWKQITFATSFADPVQKTVFMDAVNAVDVQKTYRVRNLGISPKAIQVVFNDTVGTMGKIKEFLAWFMSLLQQHQASAWNICPECGCEVSEGKWMLIEGLDRVLLTSLDEIAWLLNVRGSDIDYNPLVMSYLLVSHDSVDWFVRKSVSDTELDPDTQDSFDELSMDRVNVLD